VTNGNVLPKMKHYVELSVRVVLSEDGRRVPPMVLVTSTKVKRRMCIGVRFDIGRRGLSYADSLSQTDEREAKYIGVSNAISIRKLVWTDGRISHRSG